MPSIERSLTVLRGWADGAGAGAREVARNCGRAKTAPGPVSRSAGAAGVTGTEGEGARAADHWAATGMGGTIGPGPEAAEAVAR